MPYRCDVCQTNVYKADLDQVGIFFVCLQHGVKLRDFRDEATERLIEAHGEDFVNQKKQAAQKIKVNPDESLNDRIAKTSFDPEIVKEIIEKVR